MKTIVMSALVVLLSVPVSASAADERPPMSTDRPDFTEGPTAVAPGGAQLEGGGTWERSDGSSFLSGPEALLRLGIVPRFEIRVGLPNYVDTDGFSGAGDAALGAKLELGSPNGIDLGLIGMLSLPTGEEGISSEEVEPTVILTGGRALDDTWSLGGQVSASSLMLHERTLQYAATLVVGRALQPNLNLFFELAGVLDEHGNGSLLVHHGYTFPVSPNFQLDVHGGVGLTHDAPDGFLGAGFAVRI